MTDRPVIHVVGLGPAGPDLLTVGARRLLAEIPHRYLRTTRHPAASAVDGAHSFDGLYERADSFAALYPQIVEELVRAAFAQDQIVYAVPGSPLVAERTVELLALRTDVEVKVEPSLSFLDLVWSRLAIDPLTVGPRIVDGYRFAVDAAGERGPLVVAQCDTRFVLSDIKLAAPDGPTGPGTVTVLQRLGLPDEAVFDVAWADLDRDVEPDHLTSLYIAELAAPVAVELARFAEQVSTLRRECPWDRRQTHRSLQRCLVEETYEVIDALEGVSRSGDEPEAYRALEEELGDLLFQVFLHSAIASESGRFDLSDVARGIHDKLHRRHPHVFGDVEDPDAESVAADWDQIKAQEKARASVLDGIPADLPALARAAKVLGRAAKLGHRPVLETSALGDLVASLEQDPTRSTVARLVEAIVERARENDIDVEAALRAVTAQTEETIRRGEQIALRSDVDLVAADEDVRRSVWDRALGRD